MLATLSGFVAEMVCPAVRRDAVSCSDEQQSQACARQVQDDQRRRYNQTLMARGALMIWLDRALQWSGLANGKSGCTPLFSDAAIQFCLTIKSLFGLALRQAMGMV